MKRKFFLTEESKEAIENFKKDKEQQYCVVHGIDDDINDFLLCWKENKKIKYAQIPQILFFQKFIPMLSLKDIYKKYGIKKLI